MKKEPLPCKQRYPYHCIRCHATRSDGLVLKDVDRINGSDGSDGSDGGGDQGENPLG